MAGLEAASRRSVRKGQRDRCGRGVADPVDVDDGAAVGQPKLVSVLGDASGCFTAAQRAFVEDVMHHYGEYITVDEFVNKITAQSTLSR